MELILELNLRRRAIATSLWRAQTWEETERIVHTVGQEADSIRLLILYACIDDDVATEGDFRAANGVINKARGTI